MRALLVANPVATTTSAPTRDVIVRALGSDLKVDVAATEHRGHAVELAREARDAGFELVIALGGDGTVNEVVNGLLADGPDPACPALAVVPGGSTNVFARAAGLPNDPVDATSALLDAVRHERARRIGLGRANGRWFTVNAGIGWDAGVVGRVEQRRREGALSTHGLYVRSAVHEFYRGEERRYGLLALDQPDGEAVDEMFLAIVQNTAPWTYIGDRPLNPSPDASFDTGLDLFGLRRARALSTVNHLRQMLSASPAGPHGRHVVRLHNKPEIVLRARDDAPVQVDGDHVGRYPELVATSVPRAIALVV